MNANLDRFSSPLESERVGGYWIQQAISEQQELNKRDLVDNFIIDFYSKYDLVPDAETIQEIFYKIDLDLDLINERRRNF